MRDEIAFRKLYGWAIKTNTYIPHYHGGLLRADFPACQCRKIDSAEVGLFNYPEPKTKKKKRRGNR